MHADQRGPDNLAVDDAEAREGLNDLRRVRGSPGAPGRLCAEGAGLSVTKCKPAVRPFLTARRPGGCSNALGGRPLTACISRGVQEILRSAPLEIHAGEHDSAWVVLLPDGAELGQVRAEVSRRGLARFDIVSVAADRIRLHGLLCRLESVDGADGDPLFSMYHCTGTECCRHGRRSGST